MSSRGSIFETRRIVRIVPVREEFVDGGRFNDIAGDDVSAQLA